MIEIEKLNHLEIMREDTVRPYHFPPYPSAPRPPIRNRHIHGKKLEREIKTTTDSINEQRQKLGIEPDKLLIISMTNQAMPQIHLNRMLNAFKLSLIEEISVENGKFTRILVQFPDSESISAFDRERALWEADAREDAILTYAQRRDIFACIESIRNVQREDRIGPRLRRKLDSGEPLPDGFFIMDIDIWYNGERKQITEIERNIKTVLGTVGSALIGDLFETQSLLLGRVKVNQYSLEALLNCDLIATVDFPMGTVAEEPCELLAADFEPVINNNLDVNAPLATVLDSGVFSGHPLLKNVIVAEEDFDRVEETPMDNCGHGTGVAGIVVYGDFHKCIETKVFTPLVRICNAKVMHNNGSGRPIFSQRERPEKIVKEAIEYFHREYGCRIFNLSAGDEDMVYNMGRQMPWAEVLDQLSRELDIVIIVSAGNVSDPRIHNFSNREELMEKCRDQLFEPEHKLIDPATAALCVTVGSITRFDEPELVDGRSARLSTGPKNAPSVFTRIGKGVNKAIKPELVDYGGNFAVHQVMRGDTRWVKNDRILMEPTLNHNHSKLFKGYCGTSFAAARVTHLAARIERALEEQIGDKPSANLMRAMLVNSASLTKEMVEWAEQATDRHYTGKKNLKQERRLRLLGYGRPNDTWLYSGRNHVTLFSEDALDLRTFHLYKIPVPIEFLRLNCGKQIIISMAYNPVTRLSRKDYLANNLWFEVYRRIDEATLAKYKAKKEAGQDDDSEPLPDEYRADFSPGYTVVENSTLQQRVWAKSNRGGNDLIWNEDDPYIYVLVTGKERFKYAEQEQPQPYALVITFSYDGDQDIQLYNKLQQEVRIRERQRERARTQVRM
ncbi:S8 family peptidase [Thermincola potens]|uniref:Subtilisin-like protease n=1 Tax=Thermincola potens (strain JR) TaxID=635013 RepID=D5XDB7_THEPJ|nr:S8 family peptidase [Thermincola potens]ADG81765.1 subtilisin-like protease [Thermincola potens JR]